MMAECKLFSSIKLFKGYIKYTRVSVLLILFLSLLISVFVWTYSKNYFDNRAKKEFESHVHDSIVHIKKRMALYENALRSGIGFFHGSSYVTREDWFYFVKALEIKEQYPGMQGVGFSMMLKPDEITSIEKKMKSEGYTAFNFKPKGNRKEYSSILYLEPMDKRNIQAIGYDMFSEPIRQKAMKNARDTGMASITKKVILLQEIDENVQAGMLMYLPLYKRHATLKTIQERRNALIGFVYGAFRMNDLMEKTFIEDSILDF